MRKKNYQKIFGVVFSLTLLFSAGFAFAATGLINTSQTTGMYPAVETWDLLVVCKKDVKPSAGEWSSLIENFRRASNFLYDATDGQVKLGTIKFREYNLIDSLLANVILTGDRRTETVKRPWVFGYISLCIDITPHIWLHAYGTIVHELGHYKFGLGDEYNDGSGGNVKNRYCRSITRAGSIMDVQFHHLLYTDGTSEFCTPAGPDSRHDPRDMATGQPALTEHDRMWGSGYTSCWEAINKYNSSIRIPAGDPDPGPCSKSDDPTSNDSHEPLEADSGAAQLVVVEGP